jgi:hypothetical protein
MSVRTFVAERAGIGQKERRECVGVEGGIVGRVVSVSFPWFLSSSFSFKKNWKTL